MRASAALLAVLRFTQQRSVFAIAVHATTRQTDVAATQEQDHQAPQARSSAMRTMTCRCSGLGAQA